MRKYGVIDRFFSGATSVAEGITRHIDVIRTAFALAADAIFSLSGRCSLLDVSSFLTLES